MGDVRLSDAAYRFGVFEVDLRAREVRKQGIKIKLQDQPFQVLELLLERPGEIIEREELQQRIWPPNTFVDFDHGLQNAIKKLRDALDDSADTPRYIETIPKHGYRFVAPITRIEATHLRETRTVVSWRRSLSAHGLLLSWRDTPVHRRLAAIRSLT